MKAGRPVECVFGNSQYRMGTPFHEMSFRLPKGTVIERFWDNTARKFYVPASKGALREEPFLPSGRFYRVTESMLDGNWPKHDPNHEKAKPYLATVPTGEGYNARVSGGKTIGQAWGRITYEPDLRDPEFMPILTPDSTLSHSPRAPHLRALKSPGSATFDFYSPYVLVDGVLDGELMGTAGEIQVQVRTLAAKARGREDPDAWSSWQTLRSGGGGFSVPLDRERFDGRNVSLHGVYRFQVRVVVTPDEGREAEVGLKALRLRAHFENGIMSIPQIFAGRNTIRFKVEDASVVRGPIRVTYRYQTPSGPKTHEKTLRPADFSANQAVYRLDAPGLIRCDSVSVAY